MSPPPQAAGLTPVQANKVVLCHHHHFHRSACDYKPGAAFNLSGAYAPEIALYTRRRTRITSRIASRSISAAK